MVIQALYEALDELEPQARAVAEEFASTGDLTQLERDLDALGQRAYTVSNSVASITKALKFDSE